MTTTIKLYLSSLAFILTLSSCSHSDTHREEGKIFHAGPMSGGVGALYFALYDDNTYEICNSGGIGQECYSGNFKLDKDTLTLPDLNKKIPLKSNKLVLIRYAEQDSSFWNWKYSKSIGVSTWRDFQLRDSAVGGKGDVYQLDDSNKLMKDESYFIIRLDSLKNYH
jgi:hypothetical protein